MNKIINALDRNTVAELKNFLTTKKEFNHYATVYAMDLYYNEAINARTGDTIHCAGCGKTITKTTYHKKFCCTKCKDHYHNITNEARRERALEHFNMRKEEYKRGIYKNK